MTEETEYQILKFFKIKGTSASQTEMLQHLISCGFRATPWKFDETVKAKLYDHSYDSNGNALYQLNPHG